MARAYDHQAIEKKWQDEWAKQKLYETPDSVEGKENFYALVEFPYPSGDLHVGHWYAFAVPDAFVRMMRMQGKNVLYPIGFDAFGLPAENAAIKRGINPADWIQESVERMERQMRSMGNAFDWSRTVTTSDPSYYQWTQWLFLEFYKRGLAYRKKATVNWCPTDQTVLANEQVIDGKCERCDSVVEKRDLEQWFFKITEYAERLVRDLDALDWPNSIKESQRNWIGESEGAEIEFPVAGSEERIRVFTTRPDTLFGATYVVVAPEHPLATQSTNPAVQAYVAEATKKKDLERTTHKEKTGVLLDGVRVINPATKEEVPVYVADYVLGSYGTGAVMAVPAHDERDHEFAKKFDLPILDVVAGGSGDTGAFTGIGALINSGSYTGLDSEDAKKKITEYVGGVWKKTYKLRDWLVSRQRYWGAPIPIVYDPDGNAHPVPEQHLPWLLPKDVEIKPQGKSPLATSKEFVERTEQLFGKGWRPETDTMDGFVDNSWYFLRYVDPKNTASFSSLEKQKLWMPIERYSGGAEHTTVHVLYSRFFSKALCDMGHTTVPEPYRVRLNRGIILAEDGRKMSKRWGNVVNPDEQVAVAGADAVRTYLAFIGPYNEIGAFPWSTNGLVGVRRFLERIAGLVEKVADTEVLPELETLLNQSIKKVSDDIESMKFNTSVSQLMILSNALGALTQVPRSAYETYLKLLAPFAPHLTEELWHELGHTTSIHREGWPVYDSEKLASDTVTIAVQIGGKTRGTVTVGRGAGEEEVLEAARNEPKLKPQIPEAPSKIIFVKDRIINLIP